MRPRDYLTLVKDAAAAWSEDRAPRMGAALAYYTVFSLAPLLLIAVGIAGAVFGEEAAAGEIVGQIEGTIGKPAAETIQEVLRHTSALEGNVLFMALGLIVLLLGASGAFAELQDSLNTIFRAPPWKSSGLLHTLRQRFLSFAMVLVIGFLLLVSLVVSAALAALGKFLTPEAVPGGMLLWHGVNLLVSLGFITVLFALLYKVLPDDELNWGDVWVGAAVTAFLFTVGKSLIGSYLGQTSTASAFGAAGSLVVLLVWVYYSAQLLLFGAELTRLYAERVGSKRQKAAEEHGAAAAERREEAVAGS
jgi:membrane protein